jgi:pyridoxal phosphate enzyme (YggS family)
MSIEDRLTDIRRKLPEKVVLVAVSKTHAKEAIAEAYACGQRDFGENRVQELILKAGALPGDIRWHMIGHLQSNKVKQIIPFVHLIHSVDSLKLLQEIERQAARTNRTIRVLLQIYIATEETKFGLDPDEAERVLVYLQNKPEIRHVIVNGLMGMASNTDDTSVIGNELRNLKELFEKLKAKYARTIYWQPEVLSMGMSSDWSIAVREGSTVVRIGSSIFGQRP